MSPIIIVSIVVALLGIGLVSASITGGFRLNRDLPDELRGRWRLLIACMAFFDVGYIMLVFLLLTKIYIPIELLVGSILIAGAAFIFMFVKQSEFTVRRMNELRGGAVTANEKLRVSNARLVEEAREREKITAELRESRTHIENVLSSSIPLCLTNTDFEIIDANEAYYRVFGKSADPAAVQKCYDSRSGAACDTEKCPLTRIMAGESEVVCESRKIGDDGVEQRFLVSARPLRGEHGEVVGIVESFQDITRLKLTEAALAEEKERLLVTLGSIADGVISVDLHGRVVLINDRAQALTGWQQEYATDRKLNEVIHLVEVMDHRRQIDPMDLLINTLSEQAGTTSDGRGVLVARDGWERQVSYSVSPIHNRQGDIFGGVLVFQDITEKLKVEMESARIGKLESISLLASGVAHDFNNILTAIMNNLTLARLAKDSGDKLLAKIDATEEAVMMAKELTSQLLTFAKGGAPAKEVVSIGDLVENSVEFSLRGSNVSHDISIGEELWPVEVDEIQMHQVISNLAINADQAMSAGGVLSISLANCLVRPGDSALIRAGRYVKLAIRDQGPGIGEEYLAKVFDPYFTTKPEGSGLGLATVYSIIAKHDGYVFVDSEVGQGAEFTIYLPAAPETAAAIAVRGGGGEVSGGTGRGAASGKILIMDDERDIRELLGELLRSAGYQVISACDGEEAVRLYREARDRPEHFDCVIMDLTVPGGMGGREAMGRLLEVDSDVKAIVSSGYANDPVMIDYANYGFRGRIEKPYRLEALIEMLDEIIGGGGE
ncbi:MAG: PAS domain S-box protein [Desulfobulbales bacterium]|nr:PAS domain S-box protein [Desulfobulbales bacterium]